MFDTALEEEEPEVHMDEAVASPLKGISLALSMDNLLGFLATSLVSHEPETQGEPPQFSTVGSPLSQGELHSSHLTPVASPPPKQCQFLHGNTFWLKEDHPK